MAPYDIIKQIEAVESELSAFSSSSESSTSGLEYSSDRPEFDELKKWPKYGRMFSPPEGFTPPVQFVARSEWGALPPVNVAPMVHPVTHAILHFDLKVDKCQTRADCVPVLRQLQRKHMREKGYVDLQHNFYVGGDGTMYEGRGWQAQPSTKLRLKEHIRDRVDIAWLGDYTDGDWYDLADPGLDLMEYGRLMKYLVKNFKMIELPDLEKYKQPKVPKKVKSAIEKQKKKFKKEQDEQSKRRKRTK